MATIQYRISGTQKETQIYREDIAGLRINHNNNIEIHVDNLCIIEVLMVNNLNVQNPWPKYHTINDF